MARQIQTQRRQDAERKIKKYSQRLGVSALKISLPSIQPKTALDVKTI